MDNRTATTLPLDTMPVESIEAVIMACSFELMRRRAVENPGDFDHLDLTPPSSPLVGPAYLALADLWDRG